MALLPCSEWNQLKESTAVFSPSSCCIWNLWYLLASWISLSILDFYDHILCILLTIHLIVYNILFILFIHSFGPFVPFGIHVVLAGGVHTYIMSGRFPSLRLVWPVNNLHTGISRLSISNYLQYYLFLIILVQSSYKHL